MKGPEGPSVPPSEPEVEMRMVEKASKDIQNGEFDGVKIQSVIHLSSTLSGMDIQFKYLKMKLKRFLMLLMSITL